MTTTPSAAPGAGRRTDGRVPNQLRPVKIVPDYLKFAEGSVLIRVGDTRVLCAATIEDRVPGWLRGKGRGWVTAEYSMLPRAGTERSQREAARGSIGGRTHEIQRLVGRSLRGVIDMGRLGERTITVDCDVIQADGGTRTASITGGYVALARALNRFGMGELLTGQVAAVSAGLLQGIPHLDLDYSEDSTADVDFNVVDDRRRPAHRGPGNRRARRLHSAADGPDGRPRRGGHPPAVRHSADGNRRPAHRVTRLLIATTNRGKQDEFRRLLAELEADLVAPGDVGLDLEVDEPHETYAENAAAKADAYARASGLVSLADDSGIEVAALDWGPGVRSARWGGGAMRSGCSRRSATSLTGGRAWSARWRWPCPPSPPRGSRSSAASSRATWRRDAGNRWLRIRPDLRAGLRADHRGAGRVGEGPRQPPWPRGGRCDSASARAARLVDLGRRQ